MSNNFRIEPIPKNIFESVGVKFVKIYSKNNTGLPLAIDYESRYGVFFSHGVQFLERIQDFEVRKDDVWVITMPKCGTTWMLELVWMLVNNLDFENGLRVEQEDRCPFLEHCSISPFVKNSMDIANNLRSPRVIKSHLPIHLLPKGLWTVKPKIIYVTRDPKDAALSMYHYLSGLGAHKANKDEFISTFLEENISFHPFWWHVLEFWKLRDEPYIYFTSYERMKKDLRSVVLQISNFLEKPIKDGKMEKLVDHLSFEKMKNNPACNHSKESKLLQKIYEAENNSYIFVRKGVVGSHKEELREDAIKKFDDWTQSYLGPHGLTTEEILWL